MSTSAEILGMKKVRVPLLAGGALFQGAMLISVFAFGVGLAIAKGLFPQHLKNGLSDYRVLLTLILTVGIANAAYWKLCMKGFEEGKDD
jgi:threonine/homoserine efflux transporter RhtA